jgi:hypothetical protein
LLRLSWLCDSRPAGLSRYGNCPADGFHPSSSPSRHELLSPFLIGLGALFLTAAVLPASILESAAVTTITVADIVKDETEIVTGENPRLGIMGDNLPEPTAISFGGVVPFPDANPGDLRDSAALSSARSLPERLATLTNSRFVWMIAFSPWLWCVFTWHVRPPPRRRIRRVRYEE